MKEWLEARNILAVRLDNIGDVIMLGPALRAVKETVPQAKLTLLASPAGTTAVPLLPWVDEVLTWRVVWQDVGGRIPFDPVRERGLIEMLAARQFDAALIFTSFSQTPHVAGYVCYLAGIPLRAGESKEFGGSTLTTELRSAPDELHQVERNLRLVEHLGFEVHARHLTVAIDNEARRSVPELLHRAGIREDEPLEQKGWPVQVTGVERETELIETERKQAPKASYLIGGTTLSAYAALVERATLVICNDTLPMHLADAVGTPQVVLFSGTDYEQRWQPRAVPHRLLRRVTPCHPCYLFECPIGLPCLDIAPEKVVEVVEEMLAESGVDLA